MQVFRWLFVLTVMGTVALGAEQEVTQTEPGDDSEHIAALPCRPTIACMAEIVPAGSFEVEAGYSSRSNGDGLAHSAQLLLKYSVLDHLQLQLATNNLFLFGQGMALRSADGLMPGIKWKVNDQGTLLPSNALSVHLMMPTHALEGASQKTWDLQAWWYISKDVSIVHADINVMANVFDLGGKPVPQGLASFAASVSLPAGFSAFSELYSAFGNAQAVPLDGGWLNGIGYSPIDEVIFDIGGDVGLYATRPFTLFAGVTFVPHGKSRSVVTRPVPGPSQIAARLQ